MKYSAALKVEADKAEQLEKFCQTPPGDCGRGEVLFDEEVKFPNGHRVAIQVIASETPDTESCWTQGVLFSPTGSEEGCTEVGESFLGEYYLSDGVDEYEVTVIKETP